MGRKFSVTLLFLTCLAFCSCDSQEDSMLAEAANCFTLNFYKKMAEGKTNLVSSPFSADVLLSMLYIGAGGNTAAQLSKALGYDGMSPENIQEAFRSQLSKLTSSNGNTLDLATSIWTQKGFHIKQSFKDDVAKNFSSKSYEEDFASNSHQATNDINNWANNSTHGVIPKIFDQDLDPLTVLVLANAMYFNGTWQNQFDSAATDDGQFLNNDKDKSNNDVKFMHQQDHFNYKMDQNLNAQVLEMQYVGGDISMMVFLPGSDSNIVALEDQLTCDSFKSGMGTLSSSLVDVTFPKYEITSNFDLEKPMEDLDIKDVFQDSADFSGISPDIKVSKAIQKCVVKVNEAGSEAAVVTAIAMETGSIEFPPKNPVSFVGNHPFLFLILDKRTNIVLFIGRVKEFPTS